MTRTSTRYLVPAPFALPVASTALLVLGAATANAAGRIDAHALLVGCALIVAATSVVAEPVTAAPVAVIAWLTAIGFSGPPYADLHFAGSFPLLAAEVLAPTALVGAAAATAVRAGQKRARLQRDTAAVVTAATTLTETAAVARITLDGMRTGGLAVTPGTGLLGAVGRRRQLAGLVLCGVLLPAVTAVLAAVRAHLGLADDLLIYLVALVAITVVGGFWPAVLAAIASSLLLNWYFTPPLHTWSIEEPQNILALLLFVTVALSVGTVVHLAARRAGEATGAGQEAAALLELARTVLGGADTPPAILAHLQERLGVTSELQERRGTAWTTVAACGDQQGAPRSVVPVNEDVRLVLHGRPSAAGRLVDGFAAQAVAALDRDRLRRQAAQAEALAEGTRIRTALLAAVSHDLRTPLASIKAAVTSLRQDDVTWSAEDEAALLATVEEAADRLDALVGNLLDMSRLHTGSLQPFLRPTAVDEIVPVALRGLDGGDRVQLAIPDTLPLVATDPGLLERALANLIANALRYSPAGQPPTVAASSCDPSSVLVSVVDHGPGVPAGARERIFEPFQRLGDRSGAADVGLGLAVARGFVEAIGGSIAPVDTPGGGLTMLVSLRTAHADARPTDPAEVTP